MATASKTAERLAIELNGAAASTHAATLADLLVEQGFEHVRVATAVNGAFVAERDRARHLIAAGDAVEVVTARQGG